VTPRIFPIEVRDLFSSPFLFSTSEDSTSSLYCRRPTPPLPTFLAFPHLPPFRTARPVRKVCSPCDHLSKRHLSKPPRTSPFLLCPLSLHILVLSSTPLSFSAFPEPSYHALIQLVQFFFNSFRPTFPPRPRLPPPNYQPTLSLSRP